MDTHGAVDELGLKDNMKKIQNPIKRSPWSSRRRPRARQDEFRSPRWVKVAAAIVLVAFGNLVLQPVALALSLPKSPTMPAPVESHEGRVVSTLKDVDDTVKVLQQKLAQGRQGRTERTQLRELKAALDSDDAQVLADFDAVGRKIKSRHLPALIAARQAKALKTYRLRMHALKAKLAALTLAPDTATLKTRAAALKLLLDASQLRRKYPAFNPKDLPTRPLVPNRKNVPRLTHKAFLRAGLFDNPYAKVASNGFAFDALPGASDPSYLAATDEVTLSPAIQAQAQALHNNPVEIFQWVRNNVRWIPTWGATQDADVTLGSLAGNAMDISSLLIALLRASGFPARYVHGTIDVPAQTFLKWAGNFSSINAAMDYASAGGIPITAVISGGQITTVRMEHVWVEAAIDYHPSRGAINHVADTWVPMDASFKQYQDLPGLNVVSISGIEPTTLAQSYASSGTVNTTEGWVSGLDSTILQNAVTQGQTTLNQYLSANFTNPTVGQVIGGREIVATNRTTLAASLPYTVDVIGARYGALPQQLENTMTLGLGVDAVGDPLHAVTLSWAKLNNHKVTLSFVPATAADAQALAALLPAGTITNASQLPTSIPGYLINVVPTLALDRKVIDMGDPLTLGQDFSLYYDPTHPGQSLAPYTYVLPAGSYESVTVAGGSVSPQILQNLETRLQATQATIQSNNPTLIGALTQEDILGDTFYAGALSYLGEYLGLAHLAALSQHAESSLPQAYGTLGYEPYVNTLFGVPIAIVPGGVKVNVLLTFANEPTDGNAQRRYKLNVQAGILSSVLESGVPEQMFGTPTQPVQGVSAVAALRIAMSEGQHIYDITQANEAQALPNLHLDAQSMTEIEQALAAGDEVITHTDPISVPGWTGAGYIILDPVTGAGAYKIAGGSNGGYLGILASVGLVIFVLGLLSFTVGLPLLIAITSIGTGITATATWFGIAAGSISLNFAIAKWLADDPAKVLFYSYVSAIFGAVSDFLTGLYPDTVGAALMILSHWLVPDQ